MSADNAAELDGTSAQAPSHRTDPGSHEAANEAVPRHDVNPSEQQRAMQFTVPRGKEMELTATLGRLQAMDGVSQVTMGLNSLETVFLRIARDAEIEEALASNKSARQKRRRSCSARVRPITQQAGQMPRRGAASRYCGCFNPLVCLRPAQAGEKQLYPGSR